MRVFPISPAEMVAIPWRHRTLIAALTKREVIGRYNGSILGLAWSFFNPLLMLVVYTFVFSEVLKVRWAGAEESKTAFAIVLFVGLIVFNLFAECVNRAPSLVLSNANYVKKVVFPLEVLPWVAFGSAVFHAAVSLVVLLLVQFVLRGTMPWTVVLFPLVVLPLALATLGLAWFLASLGVYVRDVGQIVGVATMVLMFVSPIFYPISSLPEKYRAWLQLNPITFVVEASRATLIFGHPPAWGWWALVLAFSVVVAWLGFVWFQKTRRGFGDVL